MNHDRPAMRWLRGLVGGAVLTLTVAAPAAGAQQSGGAVYQPAGNADNRSVFVEIRDGLLTVKVQEAPLAAVLQEVARQAKLKVIYRGELTEQITVEFQDLALDEGVRRLIGNRRYAFIYDREGGEPSRARLVEIRLYPAIVASPPPGEGAAGKQEAPQPLDEWLETITTSPSAEGDAPADPGASRTLEEWAQIAQSDTDPEDRIQAMRRLSSLGGEEMVATLTALLQQDPDASIRREAARALARIGGPIAVSALERGLIDRETMVRWEVVRALRRTKDEAAVAPLTQAFFTDQDPRIRRTAARALSRVGGEATRDALRQALSDPDPSVREEVEDALQRWERTYGKELP